MATSIKLDDEMNLRIQRLAGAKQRSAHWIMREAIQEYVEREEAREDFKREAVQSWKHYQETGLHLNEDEVKDWLAKWGTEAEEAVPHCHD
ncbi:MAG TPA: CopG family ribbon-helix-helix protein [Mesorhizobium sp.]